MVTNCLLPNSIDNNVFARCSLCQPNYYLTISYTCELGNVFAC